MTLFASVVVSEDRQRDMRFAVTSGTGAAEVVDHAESAQSALDRALTLIARGRKRVRIFDEDGVARSLTDVRRLADQEALKPGR